MSPFARAALAMAILAPAAASAQTEPLWEAGMGVAAVHFPDYRIEYEIDGRAGHEDVELFTPHYRGAHAASRAETGFRIYVVASRGGGGRSRAHPRVMEEFL